MLEFEEHGHTSDDMTAPDAENGEPQGIVYLAPVLGMEFDSYEDEYELLHWGQIDFKVSELFRLTSTIPGFSWQLKVGFFERGLRFPI
ncbi:unnamed protein product [Linum trigynum]|uniref:Uncharacterized protein n=1 Tax=Linum trigynum TaxID=586398 RepID=A0AAV2EJ90_9ROSI